MKATELRIGNYIKFKSTGNEIERVYNITSDFRWKGNKAKKYQKSPDINDVNIDDVQPIPLTEECLLKFGFKLCDVCKDFEGLEMPYHANNAVLLFFNSNRTKYELSDYYIGYGSMRSGKYHVVAFKWIKYVHQLQNLYFALTGEELT